VNFYHPYAVSQLAKIVNASVPPEIKIPKVTKPKMHKHKSHGPQLRANMKKSKTTL